MKTIDIKFSELCDEIDYWKDLAKSYKEKYEQERNEHISRMNKRLEDSKRGVANALMFAMSIRDDENGNMVIDKESRKKIAENWKTDD